MNAWRSLRSLRAIGATGFALLLSTPSSGCARRIDSGGTTPPPRAAAPSPADAARPVADARTLRLAELDRLLVTWDSAQSEGRTAEAAALGVRLRSAADAVWPDLVAASRGEGGDDGRYLATMALGFATNPEATGLLVETLRAADARLVANALIALKLRADPATAVTPVAFYVGSADLDVRRYAPLALAHILAARRAAGQPVSTATERQILERLERSVHDRDVLVRLHAVRLQGELAAPEALAALQTALRDRSTRVQLAAGEALARRGDPSTFYDVLNLLREAPESGRHLVADVLFTYAERLGRRPLGPDERRSLGTNGLAWSRWFSDWQRTHAPQPGGTAG